MEDFDDRSAPLHVAYPSTEVARDYAERELQIYLKENPDKLGIPNATIIATEYPTEVGRIDLLVGSGPDILWVVELKAGQANRTAIGQITSYIGAVRVSHPGKDVLGLLVATDFDKACLAAHRAVGDIELRRASIRYDLELAAKMTPHRVRSGSGINAVASRFVQNSSGGITGYCWRCGEERELSASAEAFNCAACKAYNIVIDPS